MAKTTNRKRSVAASSGAALVAVMLAAPGYASSDFKPQKGPNLASEGPTRVESNEKKSGQTRSEWRGVKAKFGSKLKAEYSVAGIGDGHVVFEDERGNLFYLDGATGDQKFVERNILIKGDRPRAPQSVRWQSIKMTSKVTILGVGQNGQTIMSNARGKAFYLDAANGDMVFIK